MSGVEIRVKANASQATREMSKLERSITNLDVRTSRLTNSFQKMAIGLTAAFSATIVVKGITRAADSMTNFSNRVNLVTRDITKTNAVLKELFAISARSRGSVDAAAETFNRFGLALKGSGRSTKELLRVTEAVQQAAVLSGSAAETAKSAIIQLGQGLASGQLRGQELNSVLEGMPRLAQAIADGMGIPFGKLREAAEDGLLTAEAVFDAIRDGADEMNSEFGTLDATVAGLATVFGDAWTRALANMDKVIGVSDLVKKAIISSTKAVNFLGQNIEEWALRARIGLTLLRLDVKYFAQDVMDDISGLFTDEIDASKFLDGIQSAMANSKNNVIATVEEIKDVVKNMWRRESGYIPMDTAITQVDLSDKIFTGFSSAISGLTRFKDNVVAIFYEIWDRVVGRSLWTGIFDPSHMEAGQSLSVGSSLKTFLDKPLDQLKAWGAKIIEVFNNLNKKVVSEYKDMLVEIESRGGLKTTITDGLAEAWSSTLSSMTEAWDYFGDYTYLKSGGRIDLPFSEEIRNSFQRAIDFSSDYYNTFLDLLKKTPLVIGAIAIAESVTESFDNIIANTEEYFNANSDQLAAAISVALGIALKRSIRELVLKGALAGAFLSAANVLGNDKEFLAAINKVARGFGKALKDALSGEGDIVANVIEGIKNIASSIGSGFVDGFFGKDFNSEFSDKLATALVLIAGAFLITPGLSASLLRLGSGLIKRIFKGLKGPEALKQLRSGIFALISNPAVLAAAAIGLSVFLLTSESELSEKLRDLIAGTVEKVINLPVNLLTGSTGTVSDRNTNAINRDINNDPLNSALIANLETSSLNSMTIAQSEAALESWQDELDRLSDLGLLGRMLNSSAIGEFEEAIRKITNRLDNLSSGILQVQKSSVVAAPTFTPSNSLLPLDVGGFNSGGAVNGKGTGTSDEIPAMLSNGEFVMKASAVSKFGPDFMAKVNAGIMPKMLAGGGLSGDIADLESARARAVSRNEYGDVATIDALLARARLSSTSSISDISTESSNTSSSISDDKSKSKKKDTAKTPEEIAESYAENFQGDFQNAFSTFLMTGDAKGFLLDLADSFSSNIINAFSESFTTALFSPEGGLGKSLGGIFEGVLGFGSKVGETVEGGITKGLAGNGGEGGITESLGSTLSGLFSGLGESISGFFSNLGGGGGSGAGGGIFSSILGFFGGVGMAQGGTVPSTSFSQAGKDSVPAMLMPGEMVLSKNAVANMNNGQKESQQQVYNINVTGDVSRQTRKEIVKMIPQITGGVNATNRERGGR